MSEHPEPEPEVVVESAGEPAGDADLDGDERALLAAFDRRSPQGGLQWGFDDAMRRIDHPDIDSAAGAVPWKGLPDDLWQRGRTARVGGRLVGDVARVLADVLAADSRAVADAAVEAVNGDRFVAAWDALRFLSARVERLEARTDPLGLETAEWPVPVADPSEWVGQIDGWLAGPDPRRPIVVGESGDGTLVGALRSAGRRVIGVEPRGEAAWRSMASLGAGDMTTPEIEVADVLDHLRAMPDNTAGGVVLLGCVDRLDLVGKLGLVEQSARVVGPDGTIVVLASDQEAWAERLSPPARDLAPGRPLHPETWTWLLRRSGAPNAAWHRPSAGNVHAVVARRER